jgi:beta-galactosidase GanA
MNRLSNNIVISRTLEDEDTYVVVINFGEQQETVDVKNTFVDLPDSMTIHILGINSGHMAG